ncbi:hypothetical protein [Gemmata sp. SH-PL17]|uniref:hypothetical protein n=1 Tax=Gemmata sp. SH-PL17 TaxID=1630693 RepID=UPI0009EE40C4|nr:hypothetical protein [Gemmata sp. SH-PL17]
MSRYRERFDPSASVADVAESLGAADRAPDWVVEAFEPSTPDGVELWVLGDVVFAVAPRTVVQFGGERFGPSRVITTVLMLEWAA